MSEFLGEGTENSRKRKREPSSAPSDVSISGRSTPAPTNPISRLGNAPEIVSIPLAATQSLDAATAILPPTTVTPVQGKLPTFQPAPAPSKLFLTPDIPPNRATFRYTPAGPAPPGNLVLHRSVEHAPPGVHFSWEDRSQHIRISRDGMMVEGFGGFRSARANLPVREGKWYLEVVIERSESSSSSTTASSEKENEKARGKEGNHVLGKHVRLGWGRREASLNGPVGLDGYSYGLRDATGEAVTLSLLKPYGNPFKQGDVVGMYISIPSPPRKPSEKDDPFDPARSVRKRIPIGLKMGPYFESAEYKVCREMKTLLEEATNTTATVTSAAVSGAGTSKKRKGDARPTKAASSSSDQGPLRPLPILETSKIAYFINGVSQGIAFEDIYDYLQLRETPKRARHHQQQHFHANGSLNLKERNNPFDDGTLGYYPMISLYQDARVRLNPGPDFLFPPPNDIEDVLEGGSGGNVTSRTWRPLSERYAEFMKEAFALDEMEEEQARARAAALAALKKEREDSGDDKKPKKDRDEVKKKGKGGATGAHARAGSTSLSVSGSVRATSGTPQPGFGPSSNSITAATTPAPQSAEATPPPGSHNDSMKMEID